MQLKPIGQTALFAFAICVLSTSIRAQNPPAHPDTVPIYDVTVVGRTVNAVNYQYRSGPTLIDFKGTVLLPLAKGDATVESKAGRTEIDAHFERLAPSQQFGTEYLTYVLWAITPEGHAKNLGEVLAGSSDKAHTHVTTDLQTFGLIVTAEPYSAVRLPGDVVVMENQIRPETLGSTEPIQVHAELMPRGSYKYRVPASPPPQGPKVSMAKYEELLELYQAQNAIQIAEAQGADQYAADVLSKARAKYESAKQMEAGRTDANTVVTAARDAAQTAEDARALTTERRHAQEVASARNDADREQQLRLEAEAKTRSAESAAADAEAQKMAADNALQAERRARREAENQVVAMNQAAVPVKQSVAVASTRVETPPLVASPGETQMALRSQLLARLSGLETLDSGRGLEVILRDRDFDGVTLLSGSSTRIGRIAAIVADHPGLTVEIDGNSDAAGASGDNFSLSRATSVREALIRSGLSPALVNARGLGNSRPFGPDTTASEREDNRRVQIIIHGEPIGDHPVWDKGYSLNITR